jgi:hypothetical protein
MDAGYFSTAFNVYEEKEAVEENSKSRREQKQSSTTGARLSGTPTSTSKIRFLSHRDGYETSQSYLLRELFEPLFLCRYLNVKMSENPFFFSRASGASGFESKRNCRELRGLGGEGEEGGPQLIPAHEF